jgi:hypothetical protein
MRGTYAVSGIVIALVAALAVPSGPARAQANPAHTHVGHIVTGFPAAPGGRGLLPAAIAEADIAIQHAGLGLRDPANLAAMKTHAGHVLHTMDPSQATAGPGLGFGVKPAAQAIAQHIGLASSSQGASQAVQTHATHVGASARTVVARADQIIDLARRVQAAETPAAASVLLTEMQTVAQQLKAGRDANGNGQVGWEEGEGGLDMITTHMGLLTRAEGID